MPPSGLGAIGRLLLGLAAILAIVGGLLLAADRFPGLRIGRLPGDLAFGRGNVRFYLPLGTSLLVSLLLSVVLWLLSRRG
jgi:hypothetical protein